MYDEDDSDEAPNPLDTGTGIEWPSMNEQNVGGDEMIA